MAHCFIDQQNSLVQTGEKYLFSRRQSNPGGVRRALLFPCLLNMRVSISTPSSDNSSLVRQARMAFTKAIQTVATVTTCRAGEKVTRGRGVTCNKQGLSNLLLNFAMAHSILSALLAKLQPQTSQPTTLFDSGDIHLLLLPF